MTYALRLSDDEHARYRMMAESAREQETDLWRLAGLVPGALVADVGCGPGAMLAVLAETVGPDGQVTGVDADETAVAAARAVLRHRGLTNGEVLVGQADATGLPPASFDVAMLRHVLAHNGGREQAIVDHLATLVRAGGCLYLLDIDASRSTGAPDHPDLADLVDRYEQWHSGRGNDLRVGRRLAELGQAAGLQTLQYRVMTTRVTPPPGMRGPAWAGREALVAAGFADAGDLARWDAAYAEVGTWSPPPELVVTSCVAVCRKLPPR